MVTLEDVKRIKEKYEAELMKKQGVVGCAIGYKNTNGKKTNRLSIICYVKKKKSKEKLKKKDIIPEEIESIPIDVVESGEFQALLR